MGVVHDGPLEPLTQDPDDYRPGSALRLIVDPDGRVDITVLHERIGAGDRVPRHWHDVDEAIVIASGSARVHLDGEDVDVMAGAAVFVPAGAIHGTTNTGSDVVEIHAFFPTTMLRMYMTERNALPGTEDQPPQVSVYDARTGAFEILGPTELPDH